jgi:hypothetical protein
MWTLGDSFGTAPPALTAAPFNTETFGMTRLDAQVFTAGNFIIGISDLRGDGRPDYTYHAHVLYSDSVIPSRVPVSGGAITLQGTGFTPGLSVSLGNGIVPLVATNASQLLVSVPFQIDGAQTITVTDPVSGAFSIMTDAVTFGAASTDQITLVQGGNPPTPVGTQGVNPVTVRVVASDGITPVNGATVAWSTTNGAGLSVCGGGVACSVVSDDGGLASTGVTPGAPGNVTITATLAPAVYNPAQSVSATMTTAPPLSSNIGVNAKNLWIAEGASVSVPLTARVVGSSGAPQSGVEVAFSFAFGAGSLSAPSAVTNSSGYATVTLTVANFTASLQVNACVAPSNNPCQNIYASAIAPAMLNLQAVAGFGQVVAGSGFQPLTVRVTDSSTPSDPVLGATVLFQSTLLRPVGNNLALTSNGTSNAQSGSLTGMPAILSSTQISAQSDTNGLASFTPGVGSFSGTVEVEIQVSAGTAATMEDVIESFPNI